MTKAMVLTAGTGTRLRPLTNDTAKCLLPLAGRPLLGWILRWLRAFGVKECIINLHHFPEKVRQFVGDGAQYDLSVHYSYESKLLGTAGAAKKVEEFLDEAFYVIYSDNFSQWDIRKLQLDYKKHGSVAAMAVHWREDVSQCGMVDLDKDNRILRFVEKPKPEKVTNHYVSAGFFYLNPRVLSYIPDGAFCDFGYHVFPAMIHAGEPIYAVKMEDLIIGIDTIESYLKANELAKKLGDLL